MVTCRRQMVIEGCLHGSVVHGQKTEYRPGGEGSHRLNVSTRRLGAIGSNVGMMTVASKIRGRFEDFIPELYRAMRFTMATDRWHGIGCPSETAETSWIPRAQMAHRECGQQFDSMTLMQGEGKRDSGDAWQARRHTI